jgi:hypothetical protein
MTDSTDFPYETPTEIEVEAEAQELWNRFAPANQEAWEDEPHKAEYLGAAMAIIGMWEKRHGR